MTRAPEVKTRRDVALVPCYALAGVSAAAGISAGLRGSGDPLVLGGAALLAGIGLLLARMIDTPWALRMRSRSATYLLASSLLVLLLIVIALRDHGIATIYFTAIVLIASYLGLVLDRRSSSTAILVLEAVIVGVHVAEPAASALDAVSITAVTAAGWFVGLLGQRAHDAADRHAALLSRADLLTWTLNRRGLFEVLPRALADCDAAGEPCSLLVLDLDGFKQVNDARGHHAGDQVLRRVGEVLAETLEDGASAARIGGDEFAVVLPGCAQRQADHVGARIAARLAETIGVSIGVATRQAGDAQLGVDSMLRLADAELYAVKHRLGAGGEFSSPAAPPTARRTTETIRLRPSVAPLAPVTYAALRKIRPRTEATLSGVRDAALTRSGYWVVAAVGALLVGVHALETTPESSLDRIVTYGGPIWVAVVAGLGWWRSRPTKGNPEALLTVQAWRTPFIETAALMVIGVGTLLLATDGVASAVVSALFLKVLFDGYVLGARVARPAHAIVIAGWAVVAVLGPVDVLWAVPFQAALFVASAAVGSVAHAAFDESAASSMRLARTDALTGLSNRTGLEDDLTRGLRAAVRDGHRVALLMLDLDDFKQVNDTQGHAEGDRLLRDVADALRETLPDALATGRIGGDEFVLAARLSAGQSAEQLADLLTTRLAQRVPASVGYAELPADGYDLAVLLGAADRRSYEVKQRSRRERLERDDDVPLTGTA